MRCFTLAVVVCFGVSVSAKQEQHITHDDSPINMQDMLDASTLDVEVLEDWHDVKSTVPTRQKYVTIHVGEFWPGQEYRVPVRMIVPVDRKAKGFHLTGGHTLKRIQTDAELNAVEVDLIKGGVGLVYTVIQNLSTSGQAELGKEVENRFVETLNPHHSVKLWGWPASLSRAVTAAYAESGYFEIGKIAMSGGSKNGASPSMAIIHDTRMTGLYASRSPIWDSPLRMCDEDAWAVLEMEDKAYADQLELNGADTNKITRHAFRGGFFGPLHNNDALARGHTWGELKSLANRMADHVFISRNLANLRARDVDLYFDPGTNDYVCFDVQWGGAHHPDIPVYLKTNTGHGKRRPHPALEKDEKNLNAFLLHHFFDGVEPLLDPPSIDYKKSGKTLTVSVKFDPNNSAESGRIWWMFDRGSDGSGFYLGELFPDDQWKEMDLDSGSSIWSVEIELKDDASHIDFFSNHGKTITYQSEKYPTYISSPYTRVALD